MNSKTTKDVPLDQLEPGDTITFPDAKVTHATDIIRFTFPSGTSGVDGARWLEKIGATATREVPDEPESPLDGRAAYNAMMDGKVIERVVDCNGVFVRRKWCDGKFMAQWWIRGNADRWEDLPWGSNDQNAKWRIVESMEMVWTGGENG